LHTLGDGCDFRTWPIATDDALAANPSQAAKSRPLENTSPVPIAATMALEMTGPMPGTVMASMQMAM